MSAEVDATNQLNGTPTYLGTIIASASTTASNHTTAVPFANTGSALKGRVLLIQPDAGCWISFGTTDAVTASSAVTSDSCFLAARERVIVRMAPESGFGWIAVVADSGTVNVKVWGLVHA